MKQTFDTDTILFQKLNGSGVKSAITGGIYKRQRPLNSALEDIVVNTITLSQTFPPQIGTSNINIHVPDIPVKIAGVSQKMPNEPRMKQLSEMVLEVIRGEIIPGLLVYPETQTVIIEPEIESHYVNIRVNWNIHD